MKQLTKQDGGFYNPVLHCEKCGRIVRHYWIYTDWTGNEERRWQCFRIDPDQKKQCEPSENDLRFRVLNYRCVECGTVRGYGSVDIERASDGETNY